MTELRVATQRGTVHVAERQASSLLVTLCGKQASGLLWYEGMPVTSDPPPFPDGPPVVNCPACLAAKE